MRKSNLLLLALIALVACGIKPGYRHFTGPVVPTKITATDYVIGDDRSITFVKDRLEVTILPMSPEALNRQFAGISKAPEGFILPNPYTIANNPYTYGDWTPPGEDSAPTRFTVFLVKVKNYAYPKVHLNPANIELVAPNGRHYPSLSLLSLTEYYWPYAVAYGGNSRKNFKERRDVLQRTMFTDDMIFSGQEQEGYLVFPILHDDVTDLRLVLEDVVIRFDYLGEPSESLKLAYAFDRQTGRLYADGSRVVTHDPEDR